MGKKVLAMDFGASSGRAMLGQATDGKIELIEVHRFSNDPVLARGVLYWDFLRLFYEVKQSLIKAEKVGEICSIGIDTWGVDFGVLNKKGQLTGNPVHYRDSRTKGSIEKFDPVMMKSEDLYEITGTQVMEINTVFQMMAWKKQNPEVKLAETILMMPDLFHYYLCGERKAEISIASTSQLLDIEQRRWSDDILQKIGIPESLFPPIIESGTVLGELSLDLCRELKIEPIKVIAVTGHDTQSAMAAVPAQEKDFLFISCGTWSLMGSELENPLINEKAFRKGFTNELGYGKKTSFLKNITGLWLIQECRRQWIKEGFAYSFSELEALAEKEAPFQCFIDPDDASFSTIGNMPEKIRQYCQKKGQRIPVTPGQIVRCIDESLAMKYRMTMEEIQDVVGKEYPKIYMVGGGIQSRLLCQMTADACARMVIAGPQEASALGNAIIQLIALGEIHDLEEARVMIRSSMKIAVYEPTDSFQWMKAYRNFKEVVTC